jgi:hypothetical protein
MVFGVFSGGEKKVVEEEEAGVWSIVEVGRKVTMEEDAERLERREPQKERE